MSTVAAREPLAPLTTFKIGGAARYVVEAETEEDVRDAVALAKRESLELRVLGGGSNVLVPDTGFEGVVVRMRAQDIELREEGDHVLLIASSGARWEDVVDAATKRGLFGIENLAGIPGTIGGAAVQNIGAYGAELSHTFAYADALDMSSGAVRRFESSEMSFGYRTSFFKEHRDLVVVRVALRLAKHAALNTAYADLAHAVQMGESIKTPAELARVVRAIRAEKFPDLSKEGTAGSFFKNPIVGSDRLAELKGRFPELPTYTQTDGTAKVSLAWILDRVLSLKGYTNGNVRVYEKQPLVIVARAGATAAEVDALADEVRTRVHDATGITIEREVETFGV